MYLLQLDMFWYIETIDSQLAYMFRVIAGLNSSVPSFIRTTDTTILSLTLSHGVDICEWKLLFHVWTLISRTCVRYSQMIIPCHSSGPDTKSQRRLLSSVARIVSPIPVDIGPCITGWYCFMWKKKNKPLILWGNLYYGKIWIRGFLEKEPGNQLYVVCSCLTDSYVIITPMKLFYVNLKWMRSGIWNWSCCLSQSPDLSQLLSSPYWPALVVSFFILITFFITIIEALGDVR